MKSLLLPLTMALILVSHQAPAQTPAPAAPAPPKPPAAASGAVRNVGPAEFETLRKATNAVVLDVRTPAEFADGHLPGAKLADFRSAAFADQVAEDAHVVVPFAHAQFVAPDTDDAAPANRDVRAAL